jgi:hypothetical protein
MFMALFLISHGTERPNVGVQRRPKAVGWNNRLALCAQKSRPVQ